MPANTFSLPPTVDTVFITETSTAAYHRFDRRAAGAVDYVEHAYMSIGENGAGKEHAGDKKTPLGIYFITGQINTEKLHEKYGVAAFPLDHPNA